MTNEQEYEVRLMELEWKREELRILEEQNIRRVKADIKIAKLYTSQKAA